MKKVFIITIEWNLRGEHGHEILAVTDKKSVGKLFKTFVDNEKKESYLSDFFNTDGTLKDGILDEIAEYTDTDTCFNLVTSDYEYYTTISIEEKEFKTLK